MSPRGWMYHQNFPDQLRAMRDNDRPGKSRRDAEYKVHRGNILRLLTFAVDAADAKDMVALDSVIERFKGFCREARGTEIQRMLYEEYILDLEDLKEGTGKRYSDAAVYRKYLKEHFDGIKLEPDLDKDYREGTVVGKE